jgi:hypothetical protein
MPVSLAKILYELTRIRAPTAPCADLRELGKAWQSVPGSACGYLEREPCQRRSHAYST